MVTATPTPATKSKAGQPTEVPRGPEGVGAELLEYLHSCPVCGTTETKHYCRVPSLFSPGEHICYERCTGCGVVFRNPRLPAVDREGRYENKTMPMSAKSVLPSNQVHYAYMMRLMNRLLPQQSGRRLLDFGCGGGQFLLEAHKKDFDVIGLEINRDLAEFVTKEYGFSMHRGLVTDPELSGERFDVVISSQVFEHLVDPEGTLKALAHHLNRPGLMLIEVPNLRHIREVLSKGSTMDDSHLFYFSAKSLSQMMEKAGLRVIKIQEGLRPYRVLPSWFPRLPDKVHELLIDTLAALKIRTGLSVIATKE